MNKVLSGILILLSLNLAREYIFVRPRLVNNLEFKSSGDFFVEEDRKSWDYYSSTFVKPKAAVSISLPLILHGTVMSTPRNSFAVIEADGKQDLYRLGDVVCGAKIVAMNRNRVVLDYNGSRQELGLYEVQQVPQYPETRLVRGSTSHRGMDFAKILTQLRIKPYFENGRCVGFQIGNISGSIKQMGLQDGDIVESINGVKIDDPLKAMQVLYSLESNNPVHFGIEREEEEIELDCRI